MAVSPSKTPVRVRIAPSPTGPFHIGTARTALFNWFFARQSGGVFILRIEDTDAARSEKKYEAGIFEGLAWLGLDWDEGPMPHGGDNGVHGPYRQSERTAIYRKHLDRLLAEGKAYFCYCTKEELEAERQLLLSQGLPPKYGGHCRGISAPPSGKEPQTIRFKVPEKKVELKDMIRGKVVFDAALFGDIVIARVEKKEGGHAYLPLYNFVVVIDDALMKITHVIRGEDHLSNTPKQLLLFEAFGFTPPHYAHVPLILNPDRSKMSKRFSDTALSEYRQKGYLTNAIINFLALLGWHPADDREVLSRDELVKKFDLSRVQKGGAVFNQDKLDWLNREYLRKMTVDQFYDYAKPYVEHALVSQGDAFDPIVLKRALEFERDRIKSIADIRKDLGFLFKLPDYDKGLLVPPNGNKEKTAAMLNEMARLIGQMPLADWDREHIKSFLEHISAQEGRGSVYWPFRTALSGEKVSPDPLEIAEILGKEECMRRLNVAIGKLSA